jgi:hypothetical protein
MAENLKRKTYKSWLTEGVILAAAPVFGYLLVFAYEAGFCSIFGIPPEFISLNTVTVIIAALGIAVTFALLFALSTFETTVLGYFYKRIPFLFLSALRKTVSTLLIGGMILYMIKAPTKHWLFLFLLVLVNFIVGIAVPYITIRRQEGHCNVSKIYERNIKENAKTFENYLRQSVVMTIILVLMFIALLFLSFSTGQIKAKSQDKFLIVHSVPETVVLRIYGDNLICAPFERGRKQVTRSFVIRKMGDNPDIILNVEMVGPLRSL